MAIYSIDEDEAFAVLTWHSQHSNTKLRDVADTVTSALDDPVLSDLHPEEKIERHPRRRCPCRGRRSRRWGDERPALRPRWTLTVRRVQGCLR